MSLSRLFATAGVAALLPLSFTSCGTGGDGPIAAEFPTVSQMDQLDVQWGLPPRKSRGGPRRSYQYTVPPGGAGAGAPVRETVSGPPPEAR